jgi:hypothetical protein
MEDFEEEAQAASAPGKIGQENHSAKTKYETPLRNHDVGTRSYENHQERRPN